MGKGHRGCGGLGGGLARRPLLVGGLVGDAKHLSLPSAARSRASRASGRAGRAVPMQMPRQVIRTLVRPLARTTGSQLISSRSVCCLSVCHSVCWCSRAARIAAVAAQRSTRGGNNCLKIMRTPKIQIRKNSQKCTNNKIRQKIQRILSKMQICSFFKIYEISSQIQ